jgi:hypothetical protein
VPARHTVSLVTSLDHNPPTTDFSSNPRSTDVPSTYQPRKVPRPSPRSDHVHVRDLITDRLPSTANGMRRTDRRLFFYSRSLSMQLCHQCVCQTGLVWSKREVSRKKALHRHLCLQTERSLEAPSDVHKGDSGPGLGKGCWLDADTVGDGFSPSCTIHAWMVFGLNPPRDARTSRSV